MSIPFYGPSLKKKKVPYAAMADGQILSQVVKEIKDGSHRIFEFIGTDDFGADWYERILFEVNTGRDEVPILYTPIYDEIVSADLPETQTIKRWGPSGFIFEEIHEGGEVKFATVETSEVSVSQRQFAVGLEYTKRLIMFNQLWQIARMEREVGRAHNALLNHLHFYPILNYSYGSANQTAANSTGGTATEDLFLTIEDAIVNSQNDAANPRNGPYVLLVHPSKFFSLQRALTRVPQEGFKMDGPIEQFISAVIGYSGWSGVRGKKTVTYTGVTSTKAYLVNTAYASDDFISLVKQPLESVQGNADVSRFIQDQIIWDVFLGVFADPLRSVEEITLP